MLLGSKGYYNGSAVTKMAATPVEIEKTRAVREQVAKQ